MKCDDCGSIVKQTSEVGPQGEYKCECRHYLSLWGPMGDVIWQVEDRV